MSAMTYREDNKVLWRGVRPAHNGTQVLKYIPASNAVVLLHTVTAGKILYLNALILSCYTAQPASFVGYMTVHDELDNLQYYFFLFRCPGDGCVNGSLGFPFPLEIPEGWRINVLSNAALSYSTGFIHGYEL